jgi:aspartokinase/homoserine dehydrogenase 1
MHKFTLNGSVHKDLSKIIRAVSDLKNAKPASKVSVLIKSQDDDIEEHLSLVEKNQTSDDIKSSANQSSVKLKPLQKVPKLFIAGTGTIGSELTRQLFGIQNTFHSSIIGLCNSKHVFWDVDGISKQEFDAFSEKQSSEKTNWNEIISKLKTLHLSDIVFVDSTGSAEVAKYYEDLLISGIHIVTPSKLANSGSQQRFDELQNLSQNGVKYKYEATAGAGLPVIQTIKNVVDSGDRVRRISGVVSGTMTYIFEALENGIPFSVAVNEAARNGFSEPDPRDDLSGEDIARKFMILARTAGYRIERSDFEAENQTPELLRNVPLSAFYESLPDYDLYWQNRIQQAKEQNEVLRYVGEMNEGSITIGVRSVPKNSPLGNLRGTDNQISIYSDYYNHSPIIIQGPGAGKEVTAQALLNDIRHIMREK